MGEPARRRDLLEIRPQEGPQEAFLASAADLAVYGGAAGGGKSWALLMEPLRHVYNPKFGATIFRRTSPQVRNKGGLWDTSQQLYPLLGARAREASLEWVFPSGATVRFAHMEHESDRFNWQGAQVPLLGFDELSHFTEAQFFYMLSRSRSVSGVRGYVRATTNPEPDSWIRRFIDWWIGEDGFAIPERSGVLRWMLRSGDELMWYGSEAEALDARAALGLADEVQPTSVTFIRSSVYDNKILLANDPGYLAKLHALPLVDREQLLKGNWNIRPAAGTVFRKGWFEIVDAAPAQAKRIRFWDFAATEPSPTNPDPDWTVGTRLAKTPAGIVYVEDVIRVRQTAHTVEELVRNTATQEPQVPVGFFQDPGQAGKAQAAYLIRLLSGFIVRAYPISGDKLTLAKPVASQAEAGNVKLVRGPWNDAFLRTLESFDGSGKGHDDDVDSLSGGFNALAGSVYDIRALGR